MKTKIIRGRYSTREEIISAIDKKVAQVNRLRASAARLYNVSSKLMSPKKHGVSMVPTPEQITMAISVREKADKKIIKAERLEFAGLSYLKGKLAQFDTMILPGVNIDTSIQK